MIATWCWRLMVCCVIGFMLYGTVRSGRQLGHLVGLGHGVRGAGNEQVMRGRP